MEKSILLNLVQNTFFHKIIVGVGGGGEWVKSAGTSLLIHAIKLSG